MRRIFQTLRNRNPLSALIAFPESCLRGRRPATEQPSATRGFDLAATVTRQSAPPPIWMLLAAAIFLSLAGNAAAVIIEVEVADSIDDWDTALAGGADPTVPEQGGENWEYGFFATDGDPASFTQLGEFSGRWQPSAAQSSTTNPFVGRENMHPGFSGTLSDRWSVKKWTSEVSGDLRIFGTTGRDQSGTGDGLDLRFYVNTTELAAQAVSVPGNSTDLFTFDFLVPNVTAGDEFFFAADNRGSSSFDRLLFQTQINELRLVPEPGSLAILAGSIGAAGIARRRRRTSRSSRRRQVA